MLVNYWFLKSDHCAYKDYIGEDYYGHGGMRAKNLQVTKETHFIYKELMQDLSDHFAVTMGLVGEWTVTSR